VFNPRPRIASLALPQGGQVLVIDDALLEPERWVELACEHRDRFTRSSANAYPGIELGLPETVTAALQGWFELHLRRHFGARRVLRTAARLAMVTDAPGALSATQWICHRDRMDLEPGRCVQACVLYLFHDAALGGTRFFAPRRDPASTARLVHDSGALPADVFAARHGIERGYPRSDAWFEAVATVPARFNRLVAYDGMQFHAGAIDEPQRLHADPRIGRLSLNGFFTCRANAG
jgi:hypothetical protein